MSKAQFALSDSYIAKPGEAKKVVLLYSGSVYTAVLIKWLKEVYKVEVIALLIDIGQQVDFAGLIEQAKQLGASKVVSIDAKEEFARDYITKIIKANAEYQGHYQLLSPISRPLLAKLAVRLAEQEGASAIVHGCPGTSNDQIRIEQTILSLNPDMKIIAPFRGQLSRTEALTLTRKYKIPQGYAETGYSYDDNLWGNSIIGGELESQHIPSRIEHLLRLCTIPEKAPDIAERVSITFAQGIPTKVNDQTMSLVDVIGELNRIGGKHGIGISYNIEDMILGIKNRSIDEEPGGTLLLRAHKQLEQYLCTKRENEFKPMIDSKWTYLCYEGQWHEPLMGDLEGYINTVNQKITGTVVIRLFKGNLEIISIKTPRTIFEKKLATFTNGVINQYAIAGFVELSSLSMRFANRAEKTILLTIGSRSNKFKLLQKLKKLPKAKFKLYATYKTHKFLQAQGIDAIMVNKIHQPHLQPNLATLLEENRFDLIIRIPLSKSKTTKEQEDGKYIMEKAKASDTPVITDVHEAQAMFEKLSEDQG